MAEIALSHAAPEAAPGRRRAGATAYIARGAGEAIVFIHGVGMNAAAWQPQIDCFSTDHRVVALDMLGHGQSAPPRAGAALDDYVAQVATLFDALGIGAANVVGHSMGALVAIGFALAHPARVLRLAALNAVYRRDAQGRAAVVARAAEIARTNSPGDVEAPLARWFAAAPVGREAEAAGRVRSWLKSADPFGYAAAYRVFATGDTAFAGRLGDLRAPALFLTGELDRNSTPEMAARMAAAAPRGRAQVLDGQRHMLNLVDPEATNARLRAHFAEPPAREPGAREPGARRT